MKRKLYHLAQTVNNNYDTCNACIVCAINAETAKTIHPRKSANHVDDDPWWEDPYLMEEWAHPSEVTAVYIGEASPHLRTGVILSSYRHG